MASELEILEKHRAYLHLLARVHLDDRFNGKVDVSGVVQQTMLDAFQRLSDWQAWDETKQIRWLRRTLANNLLDEIRRYCAEARDIRREFSLDEAFEQSSARIHEWLVAEDSSPSQRASKHEELLQLSRVLPQLSEDHRRAIELRHLKGLSLAETAQRMNRSPEATAMLVYRALKCLRERLSEDSTTSG